MTAGLLTLYGVLGAAAIAGVVKYLVERRTRSERDAGAAKTMGEADHGVAAAADVLLGSITRDYQRLSAELETLRREVAELHVELVDVRKARDTLQRELEDTKAENRALRRRVDDLEANQRTTG